MKKRFISLLLAAVMLLSVLPLVQPKAAAHQIVMTAEEFIECLWTAYKRPNYYYNKFPYNLGYYDGSRISFDCWNLGKAIIWSKGEIVNNYTVGHYAAMDTSCGLGDWGGEEIMAACTNCNDDFTNLIPGEWLYVESGMAEGRRASANTVSMVKQSNGTYWAQVEGIAAKALDSTYYVAATYTDTAGNHHCTGVIAYSLSKYCMSKAADGTMGSLTQATAMYGYYAREYFST